MIRRSDSSTRDDSTYYQTPVNFKSSAIGQGALESKQQQVPKFTPKRVMGNGAFGKCKKYADKDLGFVFEAVDELTQTRVALKRT